MLFQIPQRYRFSSKSQQSSNIIEYAPSCFRYHKGTDFQANHNMIQLIISLTLVVLDTTKVQIFKQITTMDVVLVSGRKLFQIPQRYRFSSKSQLNVAWSSTSLRCFRYHKGTDFQANHNTVHLFTQHQMVVLDTTKVQIFKQITTQYNVTYKVCTLFQIPQRYRFSSKSQLFF